ncbi:short-chain dehydrogenase [Luteimicrobium album]|uniref:Short-chain dehydrogenase n=1 Tax=Luteimicrobium album TaxID=1054550 RepID=A0ABQ6HZD0_9MICO|nr:SDR family NAD(P)-dependent oxidoreductase [Luteimicrobium album]GMA23371.1 short-chain dehydrogenase [Luteimicrobium album]
MTDAARRALVVGASRNLGLGLARELLTRGWDVVGTVRGGRRTGLHELADAHPARVRIERLDTTVPAEIDRLRDRLDPASLDLLFVNAGITDADVPAAEVGDDVFTRVMLTNALAPVRVVERLADRVTPQGTVAVMSSRQGSISLNERGGHEVYRASKSALNQLVRSYDARRTDRRTLLLVHPGWVQTELGGDGAPLTVEQSAPGILDMIGKHTGDGGLQFRNHLGEVVPW